MDILPFYTDEGTGKPLILLHGNGEDHTYFAGQTSDFSARFRVIAVDTRGHGQTPRGSAPFTLAQFAEDLKNLLNNLHIDKANLLGFSDGGNIALLFALRYPNRVNRLIIVGANLNPGGMKTKLLLSVWSHYIFAGCASLFIPRYQTKRDLYALMARQPFIRPHELQRLSMPVLVIAGARDVIRARHTRQIAANLPHASLVFLPGGHDVAQETPCVFSDTVLAFLAHSAG